MKLFGLFTKQNGDQRTVKEQKVEVEEVVITEFECDLAELHFAKAEEVYRGQQNRTPDEELSEEEIEIIWEYASNHIAFFVTWLVYKNLYIAESRNDNVTIEEVISGTKKLSYEKITGYEFLYNYCGREFHKSNVAETARDFVDVYYNGKFITEYKSFVEMVLGKEVNGFGFTWEEYERYSGILDIAYANFKLQSNN